MYIKTSPKLSKKVFKLMLTLPFKVHSATVEDSN